MRVLSLLVVALAGCYDPPLSDCQFTCPDNQCPGDLMCVAGVCRLPGAGVSCRCHDPPPGCTLASNDSGICLAACSAATDWNAASTACAATPPWHLAVLDTSSTLSAGENALRASTTWIGLTRGVSVVDWHWISGGGTILSTSSDWTSDTAHAGGTVTNMCAALDRGKLYSDECDVSYAYACTMN